MTPIRLGELIRLLQEAPPNDDLVIAGPGYFKPVGVSSYRGYYEDLAIEWAPGDAGSPVKVAAFIPTLQAAILETFQGYKGGDFEMDEDSRVWVSNYSQASGARVIGVVSDGETGRLGGTTSIVTANLHWDRR